MRDGVAARARKLREAGRRCQNSSPERDPPRAPVGEQRGDEAPAHAAERVAGNVQPHRARLRAGGDLLADVGHCGGGEPGDHPAEERTQDQQRTEVGCEGGGEREQGGDRERSRHDLLAAEAIGENAARDQHQREPRGGGRHRQAGARRADAELGGEQGQQGLGAVDHREGREAADEHRQVGASVAGRAGL